MSVAGIFNVPKDNNDLNEWAFSHMANHRDCIRLVYIIFKIALPEYVLDPLDPDDTGIWQRQHQQMHLDMNTVLGTSGFNLLGVDWHDENKLSAWIQLDAIEHRQWSDLLRLG
jgi:hypothetical protein